MHAHGHARKDAFFLNEGQAYICPVYLRNPV